MKKVKYKVTGLFGDYGKGDIITAYILNIDDDSGIALCYHPPSKGGCGCFEFIKEKDKHWIVAKENAYSNVGSISKDFRKFLYEFSKENTYKKSKGKRVK